MSAMNPELILINKPIFVLDYLLIRRLVDHKVVYDVYFLGYNGTLVELDIFQFDKLSNQL